MAPANQRRCPGLGLRWRSSAGALVRHRLRPESGMWWCGRLSLQNEPVALVRLRPWPEHRLRSVHLAFLVPTPRRLRLARRVRGLVFSPGSRALRVLARRRACRALLAQWLGRLLAPSCRRRVRRLRHLRRPRPRRGAGTRGLRFPMPRDRRLLHSRRWLLKAAHVVARCCCRRAWLRRCHLRVGDATHRAGCVRLPPIVLCLAFLC
mmetsp:Transcript_109059/g.307419  ORF Transcript_109059/g.307419 Transcript_109059/m.307419 type:complete len:207 (-) Transcript_109059:533-1153(-)